MGLQRVGYKLVNKLPPCHLYLTKAGKTKQNKKNTSRMAMPSGPEWRELEQLLSWAGWEADGSGPAFGEAAGEQGEGCPGRAGAARWWDHSLH